MNQKKKWGFSSWLLAFSFLLIANCQSLTANAQGTITVKGQVTDSSNEPLIGVTVMIDGQTAGGAVTDFDGNSRWCR